MSFSCLTWNRGKPCILFDIRNNCCGDQVEYVHAENKLPVCRYHQDAVEMQTSDVECPECGAIYKNGKYVRNSASV